MIFFKPDPPDHIFIPMAQNAVWIERLLWVFVLSFALDHRNEISGTSGGSTGLDQVIFLILSVCSTFAMVIIGRRFLLVRPGAWVIGFWAMFIAFMLANATLQGVPLARSVRVILPLILCLFSMMNSHIAGCAGLSPTRIVRPLLIAACVNVIWKIFYGLFVTGVTLETARLEVLSPANGWIAAWIACAMLLRTRFHWGILVASGIIFSGILITITRSLFFPVLMAGFAAMICFVLCVRWGQFAWTSIWKRLIPVAAAGMLVVVAIAGVAVFQPVVLERWGERLFHNTATQNLSADISYLTRMAEADAMMKILREDPVHFINGKGIGSSYYWDRAYLSEINLVIPSDDDNFDGMWFAGHSIWTYSLLSGGVIALVSYLVLFGTASSLSLIAAKMNASDPGPDQWLAFLPFVATCCLLSETLTSNPFQERLVGVLYGLMVGLPQAFIVRSSWIHATSRPLSTSIN